MTLMVRICSAFNLTLKLHLNEKHGAKLEQLQLFREFNLDIFHALILGAVQGLTEFLPVSSSGHLVLLQHVFGLHEPELLFDVSVHVGTLIAVCIVFYRDIMSMLGTLFRLPVEYGSTGSFKTLYKENDDVRLVWLIAIGNIPTAIIGLLLNKIVDQIFGSVMIVGFALIATGTILWFTRKRDMSGRKITTIRMTDALLIGIAQGLAIIPGISRSGATISVAIFLGMDRELAGRYSFLMSIPAILGALLLSFDMAAFQTDIPVSHIFSGIVVAAVLGYLALVVLLRVVKKGRLCRFSPYCWLLGVTTLVWSFI